MEKKRRQHYVWQHYLKAWTTDGKLWCRRESNIFRTGTTSIGVARDYYRLQEMEPNDLAFVRAVVINQLPPLPRMVCENWIPLFTDLFRYKAEFEKFGKLDPGLAQQLDASINNLEENLHAHVENSFVEHLDSLRSGDIDFLRDSEAFSTFCFFLAMQYVRTPTRRAAIIANLKDAPFNVEASWGLMRAILATALGFQLNRRDEAMRLTFLEAPDAGPRFITGDQPVLNTKAVGLDGGEQADELEFLYPLSPHLAVLIDFDGQAGPMQTRRKADHDELLRLNSMIVHESTAQLYAAERGDLEW